MASTSPGRRNGEIPPPVDATPRAEGDVPSCTRAMAGLRSQASGPAARSWLTGVAMSTFSEARPAYRKNAASGAPGGAFLLTKGGRGRLRKASHRMVSPAIHRGLAHPRVSRRSAPLEGSEDLEFASGPARGRPKNAGDFLWLVCKRIEERAARAHSPFVPAKAGIQRWLTTGSPLSRGRTETKNARK
jgi:hypothetical protein